MPKFKKVKTFLKCLYFFNKGVRNRELYNLKLPESNYTINIEDLNSNFISIDEKIKETEDILNQKTDINIKEIRLGINGQI